MISIREKSCNTLDSPRSRHRTYKAFRRSIAPKFSPPHYEAKTVLARFALRDMATPVLTSKELLNVLFRFISAAVTMSSATIACAHYSKVAMRGATNVHSAAPIGSTPSAISRRAFFWKSYLQCRSQLERTPKEPGPQDHSRIHIALSKIPFPQRYLRLAVSPLPGLFARIVFILLIIQGSQYRLHGRSVGEDWVRR